MKFIAVYKYLVQCRCATKDMHSSPSSSSESHCFMDTDFVRDWISFESDGRSYTFEGSKHRWDLNETQSSITVQAIKIQDVNVPGMLLNMH